MILSCGEALIDMLPRRTESGEDAFAPYAGGALFNTAIALGRIGLPTGFVCGLSTDLFGQMLAETLTDAGVDLGLAIRSPRPTTLAFVRLAQGHASYTFYDEGTALRMLDLPDLPDVPPEVEAMIFGCISLVGSPCAGFYEELLNRNSDRVILIDPNIRAGFVDFIGDEAGYRARLDRMIARADIVKLSDEDLRWLAGAGSDDSLARQLLARGPRLVVVTRGGEGISGWTAAGRVEVAAAKVTVVDTVGAGDTVNAGIVAALRQRGLLTKTAIAALGADDLAQVLGFAARAAAITVSRAGANPPWAHELA